MKPRRRAWGSLYEKSRNHWVLRWRENTPEGRKTRSETFVGTYAQADARLNQIRFEVAAPPSPTVGELWRDCAAPGIAEDVEHGRRSRSTQAVYTSMWANHVAPAWSRTPCTEVRALDIQRWLLGMPPKTAKTAIVVLRECLRYAELYELVPQNVAAKKYKFADAPAKQADIYTVGELRRLGEVVRGSVCEAPFILSAYAGLRVGEACGMKLEDVEWREGYAVLRVRRQVTRYEVDAKLKTKNAARTIALVGEPSARLKAIVDALPPGLVYINDNWLGEPVPRKTVAARWSQLVKRSGMRYLPMQTLRPAFETHTHYKGGLPIEVLSKVMGHAQIATTLGHYDRPTTELVDAQVRALM